MVPLPDTFPLLSNDSPDSTPFTATPPPLEIVNACVIDKVPFNFRLLFEILSDPAEKLPVSVIVETKGSPPFETCVTVGITTSMDGSFGTTPHDQMVGSFKLTFRCDDFGTKVIVATGAASSRYRGEGRALQIASRRKLARRVRDPQPHST